MSRGSPERVSSKHMTQTAGRLVILGAETPKSASAARLPWHSSQLSSCLSPPPPLFPALPQMAWQRSELSCAPSSARRIWNSGWRARSTRRSSRSPRWRQKPRKSLRNTSPSSRVKRSVSGLTPPFFPHTVRVAVPMTRSSSPPFLPPPPLASAGESGFVHQRPHQGQPAECDALLLRPGAAADIRADGEGLIPPIPALRTLLGLNQPKKAQLHLDFVLVIRDAARTDKNKQTNNTRGERRSR